MRASGRERGETIMSGVGAAARIYIHVGSRSGHAKAAREKRVTCLQHLPGTTFSACWT